MAETKVGQLCVWHISNPPNSGHRRLVSSIEEAVLVLSVMAQHDLYLGELIDANAQGLEVWDGQEWSEWYDDDGEDIDYYVDQLLYDNGKMKTWFVG